MYVAKTLGHCITATCKPNVFTCYAAASNMVIDIYSSRIFQSNTQRWVQIFVKRVNYIRIRRWIHLQCVKHTLKYETNFLGASCRP